ncbi:hypothetical protein SESBI_39070 [Sesbania bispinosa]|nr:hypothetical protein SESBI_39070 [Sesbania bispinosa]
MRNATSNIKNADFTKGFEDCMLGYYDVGTFRNKWLELVAKFGLEENPWVAALYEKRSMWETAYLWGKFFAGFRTTSRCEGLHSELGKFVNSRYNLSDFLQHFQRCLNHMRFKEKEDDYTSIHEEPVIQTQFEALERSAGINELPESFVLKRWSKDMKDGLGGTEFETNHSLDAGSSARRAALNCFYNHISEADGGIVQDVEASTGNGRNAILRDPVRHNKVTCPSVGQQSSARNQFNVDGSSQFDGDEFDGNEEYEQFDPEMWM